MSDNNIYKHLKNSLKNKLIKNLKLDEDFKDLNIDDLIEERVEETLDDEIDFDAITKKSNNINRPHSKLVELNNGWKVMNGTRFKILSSYIEKENTSIKYTCDDGTIVEYCPWYAYKNNEEFKNWCDNTPTRSNGIKYDYPQYNGQLPKNWFGMREKQDYFINSDPDYNIWMN